MSFLGFLSYSWSLLLVVVGIIVVIYTTVQFSKKIAGALLATTLLLLLLAVVDYIETCLANQVTYNDWRATLTAMKYALTPLILSQIALTIFKTSNLDKLLVSSVSIIHAILCGISIPTKIIFYFDTETNSFFRGPIGYLPFIVSGMYILYLVYRVIMDGRKNIDDIVPVICIFVFSLLATLLPIIWGEGFQPWFCTTIAIGILMYCIFLLQQFSKKDALTGLLNRQSYYHDIEKFQGSIKALVSIDMNGLKQLNDVEGHVAGDTALITLADCLLQSTNRKERVYRIGGDEFIILCKRMSNEEIEKMIQELRNRISQTEYTVAIGRAFIDKGMTLDDAYRIADQVMYEEKKEYYKNNERRK